MSWSPAVYELFLYLISVKQRKKPPKRTKVNFSGLDLSKRAAGVIAPCLLRWETAPGVVHSALRGSHGNKTLQPQEVGHMGVLGSWAVRSSSHSGVVYEGVGGGGGEQHTHIHTDTRSLKFPKSISVTSPAALPSHRSVLDSRALLLLPGSVLPRLN